MTDSAITRNAATRSATGFLAGRIRVLAVAVLTVVSLACVFALETRFAGLETEVVSIDGTPVTTYRIAGGEPKGPVIVAHGFAGSRQMMDQIAVSVARQGFFVASIDLPGHGRNERRLSPDISNIDGTTQQLVATVERVAEAIVARADTAGPVSYIGHSMATDVVIRASKTQRDVGGVVAVSMYSPAVTAREPSALLVLSGASEGHLREAALDAAQEVDPSAVEGATVTRDGVTRRTAVAPYVGHVGVLYSPTSLEEITSWLRDITNTGQNAPLDRSGWVAGVLFVAIVLLIWPLSAYIPAVRTERAAPISKRTFLTCLFAPIPAVLAVGALPTFGIAGNAAFGTLAAVLGIWGGIQIAIVRRAGINVGTPDLAGVLFYLAFSLAFALALDRYGAAFLPAGDRIVVLFGLLVGTIPLMIADTTRAYRASFVRRLLARLALLLTLSGAMALSPAELGLTFTTLPVLVLFFFVYGSIARWVAARRGASAVAIGQGIALAWAIAASTPLFAVAATS